MERARIAAACIALCLGACRLFSTADMEPRPDRIRPESDAFAGADVRMYAWNEGPADSNAVEREITVRNRGDTLRSGVTVRRVEFSVGDGGPLPSSLVSSLGWNPGRLAFDTAAVSDPGPDPGWPEIPVPGWKSEGSEGLLRHSRVLLGPDVLKRPEGWVEVWVFADSVFWGGVPVQISRVWFGARGLLQSRFEWPGFPAETDGGKTGWRREVVLR